MAKKAKVLSVLLSVILTCIALFAIVPNIAFADVIEITNKYVGFTLSNDVDLHAFTKKTTVSYDLPTITIFTHGMEGTYKHWGHKAWTEKDVDNNEIEVVYMSQDSLPMQLAKEHSADVYVAKSLTEYEDVKDDVYLQVGDELYYHCEETSTGFSIRKVASDGRVGGCITGDELLSFENHTIIIFSQSYKQDLEFDLRYKELHDIIDKLSYEYFLKYDYLPRINLIGHSRGGLLNMQYAIDHPYNVDSIYGIGSPYNGSYPADILAKLESYLDEDLGFSSPVETQDIQNYAPQLLKQWNEEHVYCNVKFKTLTASFDFNFLLAMLASKNTHQYLEYNKDLSLDLLKNALDLTITAIKTSTGIEESLAILSVLGRFGPLTPLLLLLDIVKTIETINLAKYISQLERAKDSANSKSEYILLIADALYEVRENGVSILNALIQALTGDNSISNNLLGDFLVELSSQRADGYVGVSNLYHKSFTANVNKIDIGNFECDDGNPDDDVDEFSLVSTDSMPNVPHNLECRNPDVIKSIMNDIKIGKPYCMHTYDGYYIYVDYETHSAFCTRCETIVYIDHVIFNAVSAGSGGHTGICRDCGVAFSESHQPYYNSLKGMCMLCGYKGPIDKFYPYLFEQLDEDSTSSDQK